MRGNPTRRLAICVALSAALSAVAAAGESSGKPALEQGDVQAQFLVSKGIEMPASDKAPESRELTCRRLALSIFRYRNALHNEQHRFDVKELVDQAAQLALSTEVYFHLECSAERLLPQDVSVKDDGKRYYGGADRK